MGTRKLIAAGVAALVLACAGPHVTVNEVSLRRGARAGQYEVEARLANSGGRGEVRVTVRLRDRSTGEVVSQTRIVAVEHGDRVALVLPVAAPPADYVPAVSVDYPP